MDTITAQQLNDWLNGPGETLVIDVLPSDHYAAGHVPSATNVPLAADRFVDAVERVAGRRDRPLVLYCASLECDLSSKAAEHLEQAGFTSVTDFEGGIEEWEASGYEVSRNGTLSASHSPPDTEGG